MSYGFKTYLYNFLFTNSPENETTICSMLSGNILNSNISDEIHGIFQCIHQRSLVLNTSSHQPCSFEWWNYIFLWIKARQVDLHRIAAEGGTWSVFLVLLCASCQLHRENSIFYIFTSKDHFKNTRYKTFHSCCHKYYSYKKGIEDYKDKMWGLFKVD